MTEHKPNYLILIPTMYYAMLVSKNFNIDNFKEVEFLVQGGSAPLAGVQQNSREWVIILLMVMV